MKLLKLNFFTFITLYLIFIITLCSTAKHDRVSVHTNNFASNTVNNVTRKKHQESFFLFQNNHLVKKMVTQ
ncbi:unnamed protein product [Leptidea sinapis]|uniref:Uncharacterized protein n=1 Tax=Leptidea sinapis TaxID=189913 RepID=A0A5E4QZM5_9NEOP|nr:unnamed protein product [Leptidea sinapis]